MIGLVKFSSMAKNRNKNLGSAYTLMNIADDDKKSLMALSQNWFQGNLQLFFNW